MSECVLFAGRGRRGRGEYGAVTRNKKCYLAHRLAYEDVFGPIPSKNDVHHTCENKLCVNPEHLEVVPRGEHRRKHHRRERCVHGHPIITAPSGRRYCATCQRERERRQRNVHA